MRRILILLCLLMVIRTVSVADHTLTTIFVVRHAEKSLVPENDPVLSGPAKQRAQGQAGMLTDAEIQELFVTDTAHSKETAEPLAENLKIGLSLRDPKNRQKLFEEIRRYEGKSVLLVGHSNTLPAFVIPCGLPPIPEIPDHQYDDLFIIFRQGQADLFTLLP